MNENFDRLAAAKQKTARREVLTSLREWAKRGITQAEVDYFASAYGYIEYTLIPEIDRRLKELHDAR